jgi:hypothetical protein
LKAKGKWKISSPPSQNRGGGKIDRCHFRKYEKGGKETPLKDKGRKVKR